MPPQIENQTPPNLTPPVPNPHKHTRLVLLTISMILIGILAVGYFWYQNNQPVVPLENQNVAVDETANWKTYTNTKYGFEFKYPDNVGVVSEYDSSFIGPPTDPNEDVLLISDKEGTFHFQVNDGKVGVIKNSELADKILSTFKFISTSTPIINTSNWKVGGGDILGFTILMPETTKQEFRNKSQTEPHSDWYIENSTKDQKNYFYLEINKEGFPLGLDDSWDGERVNIGGSEVIVNIQYNSVGMNYLVYLSSECEKEFSDKCYAFFGKGNKEDGWSLLLKVLASFKKL